MKIGAFFSLFGLQIVDRFNSIRHHNKIAIIHLGEKEEQKLQNQNGTSSSRS